MIGLTNLFYKSMAGFKFPTMLRLEIYVDIPKLKYLKQPSTVRIIVDEMSKVRIRQIRKRAQESSLKD